METIYSINHSGVGTVARNLSLYEACRRAAAMGRGDIGTGRRLVAFFCEHRNCIRVGHGAYPHEREQLAADWGKTVTGDYTNS